MRGYRSDSYGDGFADVYDDWYADDPDACTRRCTALLDEVPDAGRPPVVLELGIGTGRLALPLAAAGCDVRGIDASRPMLERLRAKPGGDLPVHVGDLADVVVPPSDGDDPAGPPPVDLVLCATNALFNLADAEAQHRCLHGVAAAVRPGGWLVVEGFVPPEGDDLDDGRGVRVRSLATDRVVLTAAARHLDDQVLEGHFIELSERDGVRLRPWRLRYLTPAQLDAMAADAGLVLVHRWRSWAGEAFGADATTHVSAYRRDDGPRPQH